MGENAESRRLGGYFPKMFWLVFGTKGAGGFPPMQSPFESECEAAFNDGWKSSGGF